jgi:hypothetical protein
LGKDKPEGRAFSCSKYSPKKWLKKQRFRTAEWVLKAFKKELFLNKD